MRPLRARWLAVPLALAPFLAGAAASQPLSAPPAHQRVLGLAGAPNFRDLGGYATKDGRHVRWGEVYRSSALSALTPQDEATVGTLHIASEFDLRTAEERAREPDRWLHPPAMVVDSPKQSLRPMTVALLAHVSDAATARQAFIGLYARMPDQYRPEYSALFHDLATGKLPVLVHCTAGKDRTGVASAILLSALGVPRPTVVQDYALSGRLLPPPVITQSGHGLGALPPDAQRMLWRSDPAYIDAALNSIDREYGSVDLYLQNGLGLTQADIGSLRARLTQ